MHHILPIVLACLVSLAGCASSNAKTQADTAPTEQTTENSAKSAVQHPDIRRELLAMWKKDQELRKKLTPEDLKDPNSEIVQTIRETDQKHTKRLKEIIDELGGWPGHDLVGEDGAAAAWGLAQHADHDVEFQKGALKLLEDAVDADQAKPEHYAYLVDRVRLKQGKQQLYGTQAKISEDGEVTFPAMAPREEVEERRRELGLMPLEEYVEKLREVYGVE